jgi:hypothetical protein
MSLLLISVFWCGSLWNVPPSSKGGPGHSVGFAAAGIIKPLDSEAGEAKEQKNEESSKSRQSRRLALNQILIKAGKRGLGGGIPGAIAGVVQVLSLVRTIEAG